MDTFGSSESVVRQAEHREQCEEKRDHALSTLVLVHFLRPEPVKPPMSMPLDGAS
jgi:hypothetical protein